jgi:hypothetical protein
MSAPYKAGTSSFMMFVSFVTLSRCFKPSTKVLSVSCPHNQDTVSPEGTAWHEIAA